MKTPSITNLLRKTSQIFETLEVIKRRIEEQRSRNLSVTFFHKADRSLSFAKWNDQWHPYNGDEDSFEYTYEVTSTGIHFISFEESDPTIAGWNKRVRYWSSTHQVNCSLLSVPNEGPDGHKSMYIFHQEKIRETLSVLPAWAIVVMSH